MEDLREWALCFRTSNDESKKLTKWRHTPS